MQINTFLLDRNRPRKVVFYGRVSTEHEAQLSALENQMQWYEDIAKRYPNWQVVDKYIDEGITGTQAKKRPAFMKMIADAEMKKFDLIVTREVCRFARNTVDTLTHTRALKTLDIEVFFVDDNIWTMDGDGELRLTIMATLAQEESRKVSERVKAGQKISRDNGVLYGNGNILGYDRKAKESYKINPEQAKTVRLIFDMYEQGYGSLVIAKTLKERGCLTASGTTNWKSNFITRIIRNATYKGYIGYNKSYSNSYLEQRRMFNSDEDYVYIRGDFEPIISEEQWEKCNRILRHRAEACVVNGKTKKLTRTSSDLWVQKLRCSCGARFRKNRYHKNKGGEVTYNYVCYNQVNNGKASARLKSGMSADGYCDEAAVAEWKMDMMADFLMHSVWQGRKEQLLSALDGITEYYRSLGKENSDNSIHFIDTQIEKIRDRIKNLITIYTDGSITKDEFTMMKKEFDAEIEKLTEQKNRQGEQQNILEKCIAQTTAVAKELGRMLDSSQPIFERERLSNYIRSIEADNRKYTWNLSIDGKANRFDFGKSEDTVVINLDETEENNNSEIVSLYHHPYTQEDITPPQFVTHRP